MIRPILKYIICHLTETARILLPGVFIFAMAACNDPNEIQALTGKGVKQEDRAEDVTIIYSKDAKVKMRMFAHEFIRNEYARPSYIDMNKNLKAEFYNDSGQIANTLTADSSRYYDAQQNILVWDSVHIVSKKGEQLNTSELIWNASIQKFFTEKPVKITTSTQVIYGTGMEANSDFSWYQVANPRGTLQVNKGEVPK